ncbi:MAG TPA: phosphoglycolate phosphatase [Burkholderiales bacterium]
MPQALSVRLVLFDLDGTLVHSAPDLAYAANLMLADLGRPPLPPERIAAWVGNGMARLVKRVLTGELDGEPEPALYERGLERFRAHYAANLTRETRPYPGAVEALEALAARGFALGCATNKPEAFTRPLLAALGLARFMSVVVGGDTVAARKPEPLPLLYACERANVVPARTVLVGDSASDVLGARAAGLRSVAVTYGYNQGRDVRALGPDIVVDSLVELPQYLRLHPAE